LTMPSVVAFAVGLSAVVCAVVCVVTIEWGLPGWRRTPVSLVGVGGRSGPVRASGGNSVGPDRAA
jgi:hypothetical protein